MSNNNLLPGEDREGVKKSTPQFSSSNIKKRNDAELFTQVSDKEANERKAAQDEAKRRQELEKTRKNFQANIERQRKLAAQGKAAEEKAKEKARIKVEKEKKHQERVDRWHKIPKSLKIGASIVLLILIGLGVYATKNAIEENVKEKDNLELREKQQPIVDAMNTSADIEKLFEEGKYSEAYDAYTKAIEEAKSDREKAKLHQRRAERIGYYIGEEWKDKIYEDYIEADKLDKSLPYDCMFVNIIKAYNDLEKYPEQVESCNKRIEEAQSNKNNDDDSYVPVGEG